MLPARLIVDYWKEVRRSLRERHHLTVVQARRGIANYRAWLRRHEVGDILYHEDAARIAETIAGLVRQGFLDNLEMLEPVAIKSSSDEKPRIAEPRRKKKA